MPNTQHSAVPAVVEQRWDAIDALRGATVILVVLHHIHIRFGFNGFDVRTLLPPPLSRVLFYSGYYAVIAFFVISGFLITHRSLLRWGSFERIPLRQFYWLRVARIWPSLLLLLAVLSVLHLAGVKGFVIQPRQGSLGEALFAALGLHLNWFEGRNGYLPGAWDVMWSLSVEESFYLLFPLACLLLRRGWLLVVAGALIVAGPINRVTLADDDPWGSYAYLSCFDAIMFGCVAAWVSHRCVLSRMQLRIAGAFGVACIVLIGVLRRTSFELGLVATGINVSVLAAGVALIFVAVSHGITNERLSRYTSGLRWAGRHSYETYLTHMLVVLGGVQLFKRVALDIRWIGWWYAALLTASLLLGFAVSRLYSAPLNHWLRSWRPSALVTRGALQER